MDGIEDVILDGLLIRRLENDSPLASFACGEYTGPLDGGVGGTRQGEGAMNTDLRAICLTDSDVLMVGHNQIDILESYYGDVTVIDLMEGTVLEFDITADLDVNILRGASQLVKNLRDYQLLVTEGQTPFPNNFDLCSIKIMEESIVINAPVEFSQTDCSNIFLQE